MNTIEPSEIHVLKIWWLLLWRGTVLGGLAGAAVGFAIGIAYAIVGAPVERAETFATVAGYLAGMGVAAWVVSMLFKKSFSDFRVVLIPLDEPLEVESRN